MKAGDIVRFVKSIDDMAYHPWRKGLLIEYHVWEKIATILCDGCIYRVAARDVQLHSRGTHEDR